MKKIPILCAALLFLTGCSVKPAAPTPSSSHTPTPTSFSTPQPGLTAPPPTPSAPVETETPAEEEPRIWDGSLDTLTLADFPTALAGPDIVDGTEPLYLVAQLPDADTWLYGFPNSQGLILRIGESWQFWDLAYLTPAAILPTIAYGDYDGDLSLELGIKLHKDSGAGVSLDELHMVELGDGAWTDHGFSSEEYTAILNGAVMGYYYPEVITVHMTAGEADFDKELPEGVVVTMGDFIGVQIGPTVAFALAGDTVHATFDVYLDSTADIDPPAPLASLTADVVYTGTAFGLTNYTFSPF